MESFVESFKVGMAVAQGHVADGLLRPDLGDPPVPEGHHALGYQIGYWQLLAQHVHGKQIELSNCREIQLSMERAAKITEGL